MSQEPEERGPMVLGLPIHAIGYQPACWLRANNALAREAGHRGIVGTPNAVADAMEEWFTTGAANGFVIQPPFLPGGLEKFGGLVLPELRRHCLFRDEYKGGTLCEHLGLLPAGTAVKGGSYA